jgi:hypothetical protein
MPAPAPNDDDDENGGDADGGGGAPAMPCAAALAGAPPRAPGAKLSLSLLAREPRAEASLGARRWAEEP